MNQEQRPPREGAVQEMLDEIGRKILVLKIAASEPGLTQNELTLRTLDSIYMDYFSYSESYAALLKQGFLMESVRKDEVRRDAKGRPLRSVDVTPEGLKVLEALYPRLPLPVRTYLEEQRAALHRDAAIRYHPLARHSVTPDGRYRCYLALHEGRGGAEIFALNLLVPTEKLARIICADFLAKPEALYLAVLQQWQGDR